jgi:hypothetical protein
VISQVSFCFTNPTRTLLAVCVGWSGETVTVWLMNTSSDAELAVRDSTAAAGTVAVAVICFYSAPGMTVSFITPL